MKKKQSMATSQQINNLKKLENAIKEFKKILEDIKSEIFLLKDNIEENRKKSINILIKLKKYDKNDNLLLIKLIEILDKELAFLLSSNNKFIKIKEDIEDLHKKREERKKKELSNNNKGKIEKKLGQRTSRTSSRSRKSQNNVPLKMKSELKKKYDNAEQYIKKNNERINQINICKNTQNIKAIIECKFSNFIFPERQKYYQLITENKELNQNLSTLQSELTTKKNKKIKIDEKIKEIGLEIEKLESLKKNEHKKKEYRESGFDKAMQRHRKASEKYYINNFLHYLPY